MNFIVRANHPELLLKLSDIAKTMVCGELLQLAKENSSSFSEKEYMKIIRYKTATLISACFEMGVTSCISDAKIINQWKIFGEELGIIFQLKDDLLDYQTSDSSSKDAYKDIREHKITLPFIIALQQTSDREKTQLLDFYMKHRGTTEEVQTIIDIVRERGGIDYVEALIDTGAKKCMNFVRQQRDSDYRQSLLLLVEFIRDRKF
jgi:octaprenyl-diphosphate synthase